MFISMFRIKKGSHISLSSSFGGFDWYAGRDI